MEGEQFQEKFRELRVSSESEQENDQDYSGKDIDVQNIEETTGQIAEENEESESTGEDGNQYYDSQELESEDSVGGNSPINLPPEGFISEEDDDDYIAQEKIYSICSQGKKTKVTGIELYGFFMWNLTALAYLIFLIWSYVPQSIINSWGIYYIPSRYFALAIPTWLGVSSWCIVMLYFSYSMIHTHSRQSYFTMQDRHSALAHPKELESQQDNNSKMQNDTAEDLNGDQRKYKKNSTLFTVNGPSNGPAPIVVHNHSSQPNLNGNGPSAINKKKKTLANTNLSNSMAQMVRKQKSFKGEKESISEEIFHINYYAKIPDIVEMPITVVNNVLYSHMNFKNSQ